ncbi:MAG: Mo-dependent nitrogenase C-terminal domain-containing protein [Leptodesmis sp.]|uniref:Mo-dependent nitrogenase C-terminal domain-containing protein n=1 Tax=Leptodesmis sp. TaxID=3100501 RepID=UPI003D103ECF
MESSHYTTEPPQDARLIWVASEVAMPATDGKSHKSKIQFAPLHPIREWLNNIEVNDPQMARTFCSLIPAQCPFERTISLFGRPIVHIPPLCKLNPFYEELVALRFRSLCYLADECGEDISPYC